MLVLSAGLLQACVAPPIKKEMAMEPVLRVRHSSEQTAATYYQLGKYHQERGRYDLASQAYKDSIALDRQQLNAPNALATVYAQQGRLDEAKALWLKLMVEYPEVALPYNNLGYVYLMEGNYDAAVKTLRQAMVLDQKSERTLNNLKAAEVKLASLAPVATVALVALENPKSNEESTVYNQTKTEVTEAIEVVDAVSAVSAVKATNTLKAMPINLNDAKPTGQDVTHQADIQLMNKQMELPPLTLAPPPFSELSTTGLSSSPAPQQELVQVESHVSNINLKPSTVISQVLESKAGAEIFISASAKPKSVQTVRFEVSNGNGITGMARRIGNFLGRQGIAANRLTNEQPYKRQVTTIEYKAGFEQSAEAVKQALQSYAVVTPSTNVSNNFDVRLVLGKDVVAQITQMAQMAQTTQPEQLKKLEPLNRKSLLALTTD